MIRGLLSLVPVWAWGALLALALASAVATGDRWGSGRVQARWDTANAEAAELARNTERRDAERARQASGQFEAWRRDQARRQAEVASGIKESLQGPISCPAGGKVADVLVPAGTLSRLRDAGADRRDADPAAAEPGR
ncbi:MAG: hypothetical protein V4792_16640 [Pseudomonadota bacterium]